MNPNSIIVTNQVGAVNLAATYHAAIEAHQWIQDDLTYITENPESVELDIRLQTIAATYQDVFHAMDIIARSSAPGRHPANQVSLPAIFRQCDNLITQAKDMIRQGENIQYFRGQLDTARRIRQGGAGPHPKRKKKGFLSLLDWEL